MYIDSPNNYINIYKCEEKNKKTLYVQIQCTTYWYTCTLTLPQTHGGSNTESLDRTSRNCWSTPWWINQLTELLKNTGKSDLAFLIVLASNMTIDFNMFCSIIKNKIGGKSNDTLIIIVHGNRSNHRDTHIAQKVA